jgi:hypothetical protein
LERAFAWLNSGVEIGLFYAALELRFTFEKILIKHGFASNHYTKSFLKLGWQPKKLHSHLREEFSPKLDINKSYIFTLDPTNPVLTMGYYLPLTEDLFEYYGRLDKYLHAQWAIHMFDLSRRWYNETSSFLLEFANKLVPHASPSNSLDYLSIPNIQAKELDAYEVERILRETLSLFNH